MSEINFKSIQNKLKLNKIPCTVDEFSGVVTIGKARTNLMEIIMAILLIVASIVMIYFYSQWHTTGRISKLIGFICIGPMIAGIFMLIKTFGFKANNNSTKIISRLGIEISDKKGTINFASKDIGRFEMFIKTEDDGTFGDLFVVSKNSEKKLIFSIFNDKRNTLISDIEFIKIQFEKITQLN